MILRSTNAWGVLVVSSCRYVRTHSNTPRKCLSGNDGAGYGCVWSVEGVAVWQSRLASGECGVSLAPPPSLREKEVLN